MKYLLSAALLVVLVSACVPKAQYEALETERNYYRNQTVLSDSLEDLRAINTYDEVNLTDNDLAQRIRQVEALTATNRALNDSYQSLKSRYEDLLGQSQDMLSNKGEEVTGLQQSLAARTTEVAAREAELRQLELDLLEREQAISRIENDYAPAGGGAPQAYGQVTVPGTSARTPLSSVQNAALRLNTIQNDLNQLLAYLPATDYVVSTAGANRLQVVLAERALTSDGFTVSPNGRQLLQRMASTLRNYPSAEYNVVGHADGANANALRAYEDSTDKAINVAQQLVTYGLDPGKIVAGGKGFYSPVGDSSTPAGQEANRRTDIFITIPE